MASIRLQLVRKTFGPVVAVRDVSLDIHSGELFFLLGPSGCGKTTLLRCLAGFAQPDGGQILIDGQDVTRMAPERRGTGMVFQNYALWPHMTVTENVAFGLEVRKLDRAERERRVRNALDLVQMGDYGDRRPNALSGGQQQRVALARALVIEPRCLLLDEPLSNLDAKLRAEMRSEIRRICKEASLTGVYVTHDQKEALAMADRIAVMRDGRIEQVGEPRGLYARPGNRFVAGFLGDTNFIEGLVRLTEDGTVAVETTVGLLRSSVFPAGVQTGEAVCCSIRPEAIRSAEHDQGPNGFEGRIVRTVYLGELAEHEVQVGQTLLKAYELHPKGSAGMQRRFRVDDADVVVLSN